MKRRALHSFSYCSAASLTIFIIHMQSAHVRRVSSEEIGFGIWDVSTRLANNIVVEEYSKSNELRYHDGASKVIKDGGSTQQCTDISS